MGLLQRTLNLLIFSSFYVACCALLMTAQTNHLFFLQYENTSYLWFLFASTICSYNFHWYLTPKTTTERIRANWTQRHKTLHIILFVAGGLVSVWYYFYLIGYWHWLSGAALLTFLYSAPKIPYKPFIYLRKVAIGKTIYLAFVWMYVTTFVPLVICGKAFSVAGILFSVNRFFFIYAICIVFDYRDRINDKKEGIRSMITYFSEKGINRLFYLSIGIFLVSAVIMASRGIVSAFVLFSLLLPAAILVWLYPVAKRNFSDYLYYAGLDGLVMLSALIQLISYF